MFQIIDEEPDWITYDRWGTYLPEGNLLHDAVGSEDFYKKLEACSVESDAREQWDRLLARVAPLGEAIFVLPLAAVRSDPWVLLTLGVRYGGALANVLRLGGSGLSDPFSKLLEE